MNNNNQTINCFLILLLIIYINGTFNPNVNDYNAYGLKIAMNELILVEARNENSSPSFLIQFAPYNNTQSSLECLINRPDTVDHYIYSVALAQSQTQFFFAGELMNEKNGTFIGVAKYNSSSLTCDTSFSYFLQYITNYEHQEYYVIGVESNGRFAYGFSNEFLCIFDSQNVTSFKLWNGYLTWPDNSFMPHAVQLTDHFGIIAGFIRNPINSIAIYIPIIYLINFNLSNNYPIVVDEYKPNSTLGSWQDILTNSDADIYSAKYDMSISINRNGKILVGMQFVNRVLLFSVDIIKPIKLNFIDRNTKERTIGNGKGVAWLDNGIAAVLVNVYSLTYQWSSSQIYFYDIQNYQLNTNSTPLAAFPNNHQLLPLSFSSILLNIISSPSSLAILDSQGNILILNPTPPGFYPFVEDIGSIPIFTLPKSCLPGTYKNQTNMFDCIPCPNGTKNPGNSNVQCIPCESKSFCSLGSINEIPQSALETTRQVLAYPQSSESTMFDEILLQNMFQIGLGHCLLVSPLFWTLIVASLAIIMIIIIGILNNCINTPQSKKISQRLKYIFRHTDLIGEGELWIGGLASFCIIILVSFACSFSIHYSKQYPIEKVSDSYFACDLSLRNAKFQTNIQSSSIPITDAEQKMFNLLNNQRFYLNIDLINTLINCDVISLQALFGSQWSSARWLNCTNHNSILSLSISLPYQHISVQVNIADTRIISALRIGLYGNGGESEHYNLRELNFYQAFFKYEHILIQYLPINLEITKVINETLPMDDEESDYGGIFIPTFNTDANSLFLSKDQYVLSTSTATTLIVTISETPYYVKNLQQPIAKHSEIIFNTLLFAGVCLEIFGLVFLLHILILKPLCSAVISRYFSKKSEKKSNRMNNDEELHHVASIF